MTTSLANLVGVHRGVLLGASAFALAAHGFLQAGAEVGTWLLPLVIVLAMPLGFLRRPAGGCPPAPPDGRGARILVWLWVALLSATLLALIHGSTATTARHWDGAVMWQLKARVLAASPTLAQPFFTDPAVFAPSRDYPLLQPLMIAGIERLLGCGALLLPAIWVALVATVGLAARRRAATPATTWTLAAAIGLLPMLVAPTGGGVDSGYGEPAMLLCTTLLGSGLLLGDALLLGCGCLLAPLLKPEGTVYGLAAVTAAWLWLPPRLLHAAIAGTVAAWAAWWPIRTRLDAGGSVASGWLQWAAVAPLGVAAAVASRHWLRGRSIAARLAVLACTAVGIVTALASLGGSPGGGALASYVDGLGDLDDRLARLPPVLAGLGRELLAFNRHGVLWPLLLWAVWRRGRSPGERGLRTLLALGGALIVVSMVLAPEPDIDHHIRSSLDRLVLQWTGPALLVVAAALTRGEAAEPA